MLNLPDPNENSKRLLLSNVLLKRRYLLWSECWVDCVIRTTLRAAGLLVSGAGRVNEKSMLSIVREEFVDHLIQQCVFNVRFS